MRCACMRSMMVTEKYASSPMKPSVMKSTSANSVALMGPGPIRFDTSSTAMCAFLRVTTAPPMNASDIRP